MLTMPYHQPHSSVLPVAKGLKKIILIIISLEHVYFWDTILKIYLPCTRSLATSSYVWVRCYRRRKSSCGIFYEIRLCNIYVPNQITNMYLNTDTCISLYVAHLFITSTKETYFRKFREGIAEVFFSVLNAQ